MRRLLFIATGATLLSAHTLKVTGVVIRLQDGVTSVSVVAHAPMLAGADPALAIPPRLHLLLDGAPFQPLGAAVALDPNADTITWSAHQAVEAKSVIMQSPVFPDQPGDTTVVLIYRGGKLTDRAALTPARPSASMGEGWTAVVARFVPMGIFHILTGPDHILFVLGLILAGGGARKLFAIVTAFTAAHSLTLSLTALGLASLSPRIVEPIIAFSIVVVGLENLSSRKFGFEPRVWLAFGFGFFHGFGFAGALAEAGLPSQAIGLALASFNIGVELGQGCVLVVVLPVLALIRRRSENAAGLVTRFASLAIALAGVVWFVERV
jgi:hydrogenase/urease accessory protein HupE